MKRAIIYANKGAITNVLFDNVPVWEVIEAIEMSTEYYKEAYDAMS